MPVVITNTNFFADQYNSGTTNVFQANTGDTINVEIDFYYENTLDASISSSLNFGIEATGFANGFFQFPGKTAIRLNGFIVNPFILNELAGKQITIQNTNATYDGAVTVLGVSNISGVQFIAIDKTFVSTPSFPNGSFYVSGLIQALDYEYSYDKSNDSDYTGALTSKTTIEDQVLITDSGTVLDHTSTTPKNLIFNTVGAWNTGSATIEGANLGVTGRQGFKLKQTLLVVPVSQSGLSQLQIDYSNAFKFRIKPKENFNSSSPFQLGANNQIQSGIVDSGQIKAGGLDANFGLANIKYSITNLSIIRTSDSKISGIPIVEEKFTVSFNVENTVDSPFSNGNTKVQVSVENIPDILESTTQNYTQKYIHDTALTTLNAASITGTSTGDSASITNYTATYQTANSILVSFDVDFTANAEAQILTNATPNFAITCSTQNHTKGYSDSDRVRLTVFNGAGIQALLDDPVIVDATTFITPPFTDITSGAAYTDGFPVELIVGSTQFTIDWTGRSGLRLNTISQSLILKNSSTLEELELESTSIAVNGLPLINGESPDAGSVTLGTNFNVNKGFKIPAAEVRNNIIFANNDTTFTSIREFIVSFPFFMRWEKYTAQVFNNTPGDLIDTGEPLNGINKFLHRYDTAANWDVFYRVGFESTESNQTFSQTFDYKLTTTDYDSHTDIISRSILSFEEDKTTPLLLGGTDYIESTQKTFIEVQFEFDVGKVPATTNDFDIEIYLEIFEDGSPSEIHRISSVNDLLTGSVWTDTGAGDGKVELDISTDFAIGRAFIDNTKLTFPTDGKAFDYTIYPTIYSPQTPFGAKLTGDGIVKTTGGGFIKTIGN